MSITNKIKNIIFDLDNTLYPHSALKEIVSADIKNILMNAKINVNAFEEKYRLIEPELFHSFLNNEINGEEYMFERYHKTLCLMEIAEAYSISEKIRDAYLRCTLRIKDEWNSHEILSDLCKSGYNLFLLTNGPFRSQINKLKALQIVDLFKNIYISDDTKLSKPDFASFKNIVQKEKIQIDSTVYVGDSLKYDIEPALNLGFKTVFLSVDNEVSVKENGVIMINKLSLLFHVLDNLNM